MKKITAFAFCLTLAFFLAACGKALPSTGGASLPPASSGSAASSGALSTAGGASSAPASSSSSPSSESPSVDTSGWTRRFISLPVMHPDGGAGEKGLVILSAPTDWEYDNYTTFTRDGIKVAEVLNLWPAASGASPFTDAMTEPYADNSFYPEGYGLLSTEDTELNGNVLRILHMKTWPDDADKPWYPQYMFYELDGYVVEQHFLTDEENGRSADIFRAVLGTMELHFSEKRGRRQFFFRRRLTGFLLHPLHLLRAASAAPLFAALQARPVECSAHGPKITVWDAKGRMHIKYADRPRPFL